MQLLVFDIQGSIAHFRRPDTTATHATYPFITRTAIRGLVGSILGFEEFHGEAWTGIQLLAPVRTRAQELSLLGKGFLESGSSFNRPTSVELVIEPCYRVYYAGDYLLELAQKIKNKQSVYHTYLGSAFALTFPEYVELLEVDVADFAAESRLETEAVVPAHVIEQLDLIEGIQYARVGGVVYHSRGGRKFRGTINLVYEAGGKAFAFWPKPGPYEPPVKFAVIDGKVIALW